MKTEKNLVCLTNRNLTNFEKTPLSEFVEVQCQIADYEIHLEETMRKYSMETVSRLV